MKLGIVGAYEIIGQYYSIFLGGSSGYHAENFLKFIYSLGFATSS